MARMFSNLKDALRRHDPDATPGDTEKSPFRPGCFTGQASLSECWKHELGAHGWGNNELQDYIDGADCSYLRPLPAGVEERHQLVICAHAEDRTGTFKSARLRSKFCLRDGPEGAARGYLSARITAPVSGGTWPAFWLLPTEPFAWPTDGELDILETWNGRKVNGCCLHWGQYNGEDYDKHRVWSIDMDDMDSPDGHEYGLAWQQSSKKLMWFIDGRPVMKASIPRCMRPIGDFQVMLNIAMGGNVQKGQKPADGRYELVVHELAIHAAPPDGWSAFDADWKTCREGDTM